jgi:hypothetical protein
MKLGKFQFAEFVWLQTTIVFGSYYWGRYWLSLAYFTGLKQGYPRIPVISSVLMLFLAYEQIWEWLSLTPMV